MVYSTVSETHSFSECLLQEVPSERPSNYWIKGQHRKNYLKSAIIQLMV